MIACFCLWVVYYGLHSFLASQPVKDWFHLRLGKHFLWYRLGYNGMAILSFAAVWLFQRQLNAQVLWESPNWMMGLAGSLFLAGAWVAFLGLRQYDLGAFMGIRPILAPSSHELAQDGVHQWVRHPLYSGATLILLAYLSYSPSLPHLIFVGVSLGYLVVGIHWEEQKLIAEFGDEYRAYRRRVKALIPFVY
ncbi:MAG: isoprenylcysteine carboxylmethyltransferase family protein [Bacteroidota bacterium]